MANRHGKVLKLSLLPAMLVIFGQTQAQIAADNKLQAKPSLTETTKVPGSDALEAQQRKLLAISLITSLAAEARSYQDLSLRSLVLARSAEALWDSDSDGARTLFRRAWEAAEKGDAEGGTAKAKDPPPPMVIGLRRMSGRDLRSEVLNLAARRDRALGEEFLTRMKVETEREAKNDSGNSRSERSDSWSSSNTSSKRLQVARKLLDDGEIERALEFAAPALGEVNANSIGFLSVLRAKRVEAADQRFASLLALAEFDPSSDANTVSGLSSYAFTPGFYVTFSADGNSRWSQGESEITTAPNLPPQLRSRFFQVAGAILLRPLLPPDQDFTSSGRTGKYMVIKRLLPLFDQYAPDSASALRAQVTALSGEQFKTPLGDESSLLTKGLQPERSAGDTLEKLQERVDRARTSKERDLIYGDAAVTLADQGDARAGDLANKIDDALRRDQVRQYVDLQFIQRALRKKDAPEAVRLARAGQLTHTLRAWAYTQAARLLITSDKLRAVEFLEEAAAEARRIDAADPDRARALIGVATQLVTADRIRAWEITSEAVKAANSDGKFTGENTQVTFSLLPTRGGIKVNSINAEGVGMGELFRSLTKDDLYRSIDLAKSFNNQTPRATAILTIARAVLEK